MATLPPSLKTIRPFVHELRVITVPVDHVIHTWYTEVVTHTNFGDHRLRGFWVAEGQILPFPIDFHRRPYNTLALPCECVINASHVQKSDTKLVESCQLNMNVASNH